MTKIIIELDTASPDITADVRTAVEGMLGLIGTQSIVRVADEDAAIGMDSRFWTDDSLDSTDAQPYGTSTVGIVDESAGGVIAYVHEGNAQRIIRALAASLPEEVGTV